MATITPINPNRAMTSYAPTAANSDIDTALAQIKAQMPAYRKYERYYDGDHPLTFATDKFRNAFGSQLREFAYNVCPMVVDALPDRLTVTGFEVEKGTEQNGTAAWEIWQQNRMDQRQGEVYQEASLSGDGYVLVWPSPLDQTLPTIYPQRACHMTVKYDGEIPGLIKWAAKLWISDEGYKRLNLYYADRIERYVSRSASKDNIMPDNASTFVRYVDSMGDADEREEGVAAAIGAGYDQ